jgi:uncharacterized surface protein with fasciclin (FAS1) repeats
MFTALAVSAALMAASLPVPATSTAASAPSQNIVQVAASAPQFSTLGSLVKQAGLVSALEKGKLTVFAPTNGAFAARQKANPKLFAQVAHSKTLLEDVLLYHLVSGALQAKQVVAHRSLKTLLGQSVKVAVRGGNVFINQAMV